MELDQELLAIGMQDQGRKRLYNNQDLSSQALKELNVERLKQIISEHGFPTISKVGKPAARIAWLIVQTSDDLPLMKQVAQFMENNLDDIDPTNLAELTDKIAILENRPQTYGTQIRRPQSGAGAWETYPIKDPENVNQRRSQLGLPSLEQQMRYLESI